MKTTIEQTAYDKHATELRRQHDLEQARRNGLTPADLPAAHRDEYIRGGMSYDRGEPSNENPFCVGSNPFIAWSNGWHDEANEPRPDHAPAPHPAAKAQPGQPSAREIRATLRQLAGHNAQHAKLYAYVRTLLAKATP